MLFALLVVLAGVPVSGRVVDAQTQNPIAGAHVVLLPAAGSVPPEFTGPLQAMTDVNGRFVFDGVVPGRYRMDVQKIGFAPLADPSSAAVLEVTAQGIANLELRLKKGGAITGRIVDAAGDPLASITVSALRQTGNGPTGVMGITTQMAQTNDIGEFRLAGLPEGEYVVIAAPMPQPPFGQPSAASGGVVLSPTYYPGTTNKDAAQIISLASQQTVSDLQFSLVSTPAYQVSGVVVDEAGAPLRGAMVTLMTDSRNGGIGAAAMGRSDENGMFKIGGVSSGTYRLAAGMPTPGGLVTGGIYVGAAAVGGAGAGGFVSVTGGGAAVGGPGVPPPMPMAGGPMPAPIEVIVDNADVTGLKIVLTTRR